MPTYCFGKEADFWFRLTDIRCLAARDLYSTIQELRKLRNVRYHHKKVSLYGGIVEPPLIVTRPDRAKWFDDTPSLTQGRLWAERHAERRGETEKRAKELRDDLIGPEAWSILEPSTRDFLTCGEVTFKARRDDPAFDFSGPMVEYSKAIETEVNALVFPTLQRFHAKRGSKAPQLKMNNRTYDLRKKVPHQSLGTLQHVVRDGATRHALQSELGSGFGKLVADLPRDLDRLRKKRNKAAHSKAVEAEHVAAWRREILGIGCEGLVVRLAAAKQRSREKRVPTKLS
jgi:hypothetical protein